MWRSKRGILVGAFIALIALAGIFAFVSFRRADGPGAVPENPNAEAGRAEAPVGPDGESETLVYTHPEPYFSFRYPAGFVVSALPPDDSGQTVLARATDDIDISIYQNIDTAKSQNIDTAKSRNVEISKLQFQIRISEFDEPGPITPERIRQDIPDMVIEEAQTVLVGQKPETRNPKPEATNGGTDGVPALAFLSRDPSLGTTREVWFVSGGFLYQITAYAEMDEVLGKILETWKFQ